MPTVEEVMVVARGLNAEQQAILVEQLTWELQKQAAPDPAVESAWKEVVQVRLRDLQEGRVVCVPSELAFAQVRQRSPK